MPRPTQRQVHVDTAMTQVSIAYSNADFIASQVYPIVTVSKQSDVYFVYTKGDWFRDEARPRAPGNPPNEAGYPVSTCPYICVNYAIRKAVPYEVRDNADDPIQPEMEAVEFGTEKIELGLEIRVATSITTVGNWGTSTSPTTQWNTDTSDPFDDLKTAVAGVRDSIGRRPNKIVMGSKVWDELMIHPDLVARAQYTRVGGALQPEEFARLFGIDQVLIGEALKNTALEGATDSISAVWGKNLWVGYVAPNPALRTPTAGLTFRWNAREVNRFEMPDSYKTVFDVQEYTDERITASDAGYLIESAVA